MDINGVKIDKLINQMALNLQKEKITVPSWINMAKTGISRQKIPSDTNWWYFRMASILRQISINQIGVSRLRTKYGSRQNRGYAPEKFKKAGGNNIRKAMQELEKLELVERSQKGRKLTLKGKNYIEKAINEVKKS
ncbi:MAG: 30S ribosomal protein S19e [Candidatus Nanohalarchaeota archaeon]|nr:MAG: 30S ribosomal protein S19e [Candidatus Nanohaloarchaeota archaeon]